MRFVVRVPVLSEQMAVALPITSHLSRWRTKLLSFIMRCSEYMREMVTARGRPSGMATTAMVMPVMTASRRKEYHFWSSSSSLLPVPSLTPQRIMRTVMVSKATASPALPMKVAMASSFCCRSVWVSGDSRSARVLPHWLFAPTATTTMRPVPFVMVVPLMRKRFFSTDFLTSSDSPVSALSSTTRLLDSTSTPSPGIWSPVPSSTMSPTTSSVLSMFMVVPPLTTGTTRSFRLARSAMNFFSLDQSLMDWTATTMITASMIAVPSIQPVSGSSTRQPIMMDRMPAPVRRISVGSWRASHAKTHSGVSFGGSLELGPYLTLRASISSPWGSPFKELVPMAEQIPSRPPRAVSFCSSRGASRRDARQSGSPAFSRVRPSLTTLSSIASVIVAQTQPAGTGRLVSLG
mmetsp:Transcript_4290/g.13725  ORF Transcript_4290/g.13725 Transcript_4290/m.13725 type:complete len:405 (-) Transcript_4290:1425-2639(-)